MEYDAIHSAYLACPDPAAACGPYERLGLLVSADAGDRLLEVGPASQRFALQFLGDPEAAPFRAALPGGSGLAAISLRTRDAAAVTARLLQHGQQKPAPFRGLDLTAVWLGLRAEAGTDLVLVQAGAANAAAPDHDFPLLRLDHLAAFAPDLDAKTRFWTDVLGVPVAGEVVTPTLVIRQLRIGGAVLELLGAASPDSPILQRPPGLLSMASWEVDDLDAAVRQARAAGFTASDPAAGPLPGTRVSTIPAAELAGVNMQLLQYV
jgi:catechol 2,3-dioxygenase-like lactoylglutathione lyase family enzyme